VPTFVRLFGALRLAISVLTAMGLSLALNWPDPKWAAIATIVMHLPFLGATIDRGITRMLGTVVGAVLGLGLVTVFAQDQRLFLVFVFFFGTWAMYMGQGNLYPYSFMLGAVTALIVALPTFNTGAAAPAQAWMFAYYRAMETGLGILVSLVVNSLLFPVYAGPKYRALLADSIANSRELLSSFFQDHLASRASATEMAEKARNIHGVLLASGPLFNFALRDTSAIRRRRAAYEAMAEDLRALLAAVSELYVGRQPFAPGHATYLLAPTLQKMCAIVLHEFQVLHEAFVAGQCDLPPAGDFAGADTDFLAAYEQARRGPVIAGETVRLMGVRIALGDVWAALGELRVSLAAVNGPVAWQDRLPVRPAPPATSLGGQYNRLKLALKAGLAVTIGTYIYLFTNTPGGMSIPVAALFFVVITVLVRFQASLPLVGAMLLGSVMAGLMLYWIFPMLDGYFSLCLALLPGLLFWGYVSGNPRNMGVGMLGCILFLYNFDLTENQVYSLQAFTSLTIGQVVGTLLSALCLSVPWPRHPQKELQRNAARFWASAHDLLAAMEIPLGPLRESAESLRTLVQCALVLPCRAADWLGDLPPRRFPAPFRQRVSTHLAAAQNLGQHLRALEHARAHLQPVPFYDEIAPDLARLRDALLAELASLRDAMTAGCAPVPPPDLLATYRRMSDHLETMRASGRTLVISAAEIAPLLALLARYQDVLRDLTAARAALADDDYPALAHLYFL